MSQERYTEGYKAETINKTAELIDKRVRMLLKIGSKDLRLRRKTRK